VTTPYPDLEALIPIIVQAGSAIMDVYASDFEVIEKQDQSPVTVADQKGEAIIRAGLAALAPDIQFVGEEMVSDDGAPAQLDRRFWLVDPLDGTKEFIKRGGDFTVNIGLIDDGVPVLGLVYAPDIGTLYGGAKGHGAWMAPVKDGIVGEKQAITGRPAPDGPPVIVASKSHRSPELEAYIAEFAGADTTAIGSSLKLCLLASGKADLYPRLGPTCEWDTAAAHAVLLAAGGVVLAPGGAPLSYGKDPVKFLNPWFLAKANPDFDAPNLDGGTK